MLLKGNTAIDRRAGPPAARARSQANSESENFNKCYHQDPDEDRANLRAARTRCAIRRGALLALLVVADVEHPHRTWMFQVLRAEFLEGQVGVCHLSRTIAVTQIPPGSAALHAGCDVQTIAIRPRAVVHHVPGLTPMRKRIWRAGGTVALRSTIVRWMAMAHSTSCWTLRNSARMPSPAVS